MRRALGAALVILVACSDVTAWRLQVTFVDVDVAAVSQLRFSFYNDSAVIEEEAYDVEPGDTRPSLLVRPGGTTPARISVQVEALAQAQTIGRSNLVSLKRADGRIKDVEVLVYSVGLVGPCEPDELFCHEDELLRCNAEGTAATLVRSCLTGCYQGLCLDGELNCIADPCQLPGLYATALQSIAVAGNNTLHVDDTSGFAVGDEVLVVQMLGSNAGTFEFGRVNSIDNELVLADDLRQTYSSASLAQVVRVPWLSQATIGTNARLTASFWDGRAGGILALHVVGTMTIDTSGVVDMTGAGFPGGTGPVGSSGGAGGTVDDIIGFNSGQAGDPGAAGEAGHGPAFGNGGSSGGGAGQGGSASLDCSCGGSGAGTGGGGGGGGGYGTAGVQGESGESGIGGGSYAYNLCTPAVGGSGVSGPGGAPGSVAGCADFDSDAGCLLLGSGGGSGASGAGGGGGGCYDLGLGQDSCLAGAGGNGGAGGDGGRGGGAIVIFAGAITHQGQILAGGEEGATGGDGGRGEDGSVQVPSAIGVSAACGGGGGAPGSGGGGGAGGLIWLAAPVMNLDNGILFAEGGNGGSSGSDGGNGGNCDPEGGSKTTGAGGGAGANPGLGGSTNCHSPDVDDGESASPGGGGQGGAGRIKCDNTAGDCAAGVSLPPIGSSEPL